MTRHEAEMNLNKYVAIKADGLKCGYKLYKILHVDPHEKSLWGKGVITFKGPDGYGKPIKIRMSFEQAHVYDGEDSPIIPEPRKRKRNNIEKRRRRRRNV